MEEGKWSKAREWSKESGVREREWSKGESGVRRAEEGRWVEGV